MNQEYIINYWSDGCSILFRCYNRMEWINKIKSLVKEYHIKRGFYRTIEREGVTVFSFCTPNSSPSYFRWFNAEVQDGHNVEYVLPKELRGYNL